MSYPSHPPVHPAALAQRESFHRDTLDEVTAAVARDPVVVVGMGWNPVVGQARRALDGAGVPYTYLGYGNYLSGWRRRLAIKLWAGWPTFPMVFVQGRLIGGGKDITALIKAGELAGMIAAGR